MNERTSQFTIELKLILLNTTTGKNYSISTIICSP